MLRKHVVFGVAFVLALAGSTHVALAAPYNSGSDNIVANYATGPHGIPGDYNLHLGGDVVKRSGNSGNFEQWFTGWSEENGGIYIGHHSSWKVSKDGTCKANEVTVPNASASWGDYLVAGATYCVRTNDFSY